MPRFIKTRVILVIATAVMMLGTIVTVATWRAMPTCNDEIGMFCKYDAPDNGFSIFGFPVYL